MWWWLAQTLVVASGLSFLALCASGLRRAGKVTPALEHLLWALVLVKLVTPPWLEWPQGMMSRLAELSRPAIAVPRPAADTVQLSTAGKPPTALTASETPLADSAPAATAAEIQQAFDFAGGELGESAASLDAPELSSQAPPPAAATEGFLSKVRAWNWTLAIGPVIAAWGLGCLVMAVAHGRRIHRVRRLVDGSESAPEALEVEIARLAARLRVSPPRVRTLAGIGSPFVWCCGRPTLLWPAELTAPAELRRLQGVLVHELAHLKRRDHWTGWLELAAGCVWWWCPLVWFARRRLRVAAELACDAWVLWALPNERRSYATSLVEISEHVSRRAWATPAWGAAGEARHTLERRLVMILREKCPRTLSWGGMLLVALAALVAAPSWSTGQSDDAPAEKKAQIEDEPALERAAPGFGLSLDFAAAFAQSEASSPAPQTVPGRGALPGAAAAEAAPGNPAVAPSGAPPGKGDNDPFGEPSQKGGPGRPGAGAPPGAAGDAAVAPGKGAREFVIDPETGKPIRGRRPAAPNNEKHVLRVFKLKHRQPQEMASLVSQLLMVGADPDDAPPVAGNYGGGGYGRGGAGYGPPAGGRGGPGYGPPRAGAGYGTAPGYGRPSAESTTDPAGYGPPGGGYGVRSTAVLRPYATSFPDGLRIATMDRNNSLAAKGPKSSVDKVADIVQAFDVDEGQPVGKLERFGDLRVFNFENASGDEIAQLIVQLGVNVRVVEVRNRGENNPTAGESRGGTLIVAGAAGDLEQVQELIKSLQAGASGENSELDPRSSRQQ
ncbi:MAG: M56 family metallopeptidase [Pirellulales bacterium]